MSIHPPSIFRKRARLSAAAVSAARQTAATWLDRFEWTSSRSRVSSRWSRCPSKPAGRGSPTFMVIERGEARVLHGGDELAGLGPGDFIGEIGAHNDEVRNATVIAKEPMTVIVLTARDFRRAVDAYPSVKSMVEAAVADRTHSLALG